MHIAYVCTLTHIGTPFYSYATARFNYYSLAHYCLQNIYCSPVYRRRARTRVLRRYTYMYTLKLRQRDKEYFHSTLKYVSLLIIKKKQNVRVYYIYIIIYVYTSKTPVKLFACSSTVRYTCI